MIGNVKLWGIGAGILGAVMLAGFGVIQWQGRKIDHLMRVAQDQQKRAERAEATINERDQSIGALEQAIRDSRERTARYEGARRSVAGAASTRACVDSPGVRAALDGLRAVRTSASAAPASARTVHPVAQAAGAGAGGR